MASEIADLGGKAIPLLCDVADRAQVDAAVAATAEAFGGLDAIVNNAAVGAQKLLADLTDEEVEKSWRVETMGTFVRHVSRASAPAQNGGAIVNLWFHHSDRGQRVLRRLCDVKGGHPRPSRVAARE
ncbi:SDR family oxidoreductase [Streptomyces sp. KL116D]|uniref:SDR family oxidoreductase n=1 Tax=Streptomyces sp. KL116D TaxID=3045152 RepID=UPI003557B057